jgi:hypothetical protein
MDFKPFGKIVEFIELNNYPLEIEEYSKLPYNNTGYWMPYRTELPYIEVKKLINHINYILSGIEGVVGKYNEATFQWELEWGTKPIEYAVEDHTIKCTIIKKKMCALYASNIAAIKFPHNIPCHEDMHLKKTSCKFTIMLSYCTVQNKIIIEYNRLKGCLSSFFYITNIIRENFKEEETKKYIQIEANWIKRKNYLMFSESIYSIKNIITDIVCDDYCRREICSYI